MAKRFLFVEADIYHARLARVSDGDSCADVGMQLAVPRTSAHFASMLKQFGKKFFKVVPGVYGDRPGDYSKYAMSSTGKDAETVRKS